MKVPSILSTPFLRAAALSLSVDALDAHTHTCRTNDGQTTTMAIEQRCIDGIVGQAVRGASAVRRHRAAVAAAAAADDDDGGFGLSGCVSRVSVCAHSCTCTIMLSMQWEGWSGVIIAHQVCEYVRVCVCSFGCAYLALSDGVWNA